MMSSEVTHECTHQLRLMKHTLADHAPCTDQVRVVQMPIKPVPASRPRVSKYGTYYGKKYTGWRNEVRRLLPQFDEPLHQPLIVTVEIRILRPRTSKLDYPGGDVDNYVKGIFDAINDNKTIWNDDKQIIGTWIDKQWAQDEESEGTTVVIYPIL